MPTSRPTPPPGDRRSARNALSHAAACASRGGNPPGERPAGPASGGRRRARGMISGHGGWSGAEGSRGGFRAFYQWLTGSAPVSVSASGPNDPTGEVTVARDRRRAGPSRRGSATTRSSARSAKAAWAWSTPPVTSGWPGPSPSRRCRRRRRTRPRGSACGARPAPPPASTIPTSARSTRSARTPGACSSPWSCSRARRSRPGSSAAPSPPPRRCRSAWACCPRWPRCTPAASSTAT